MLSDVWDTINSLVLGVSHVVQRRSSPVTLTVDLSFCSDRVPPRHIGADAEGVSSQWHECFILRQDGQDKPHNLNSIPESRNLSFFL